MTARAIGNGLVCLAMVLSMSCAAEQFHGSSRGDSQGIFNIRHFGAVGDGV